MTTRKTPTSDEIQQILGLNKAVLEMKRIGRIAEIAVNFSLIVGALLLSWWLLSSGDF